MDTLVPQQPRGVEAAAQHDGLLPQGVDLEGQVYSLVVVVVVVVVVVAVVVAAVVAAVVVVVVVKW